MQHLTQTWITLKVVNSSQNFAHNNEHQNLASMPMPNMTSLLHKIQRKNWKQNIATHWANCVPTTVRHTYTIHTSNCTANQKHGMKSKQHVEVSFLGTVPNYEPTEAKNVAHKKAPSCMANTLAELERYINQKHSDPSCETKKNRTETTPGSKKHASKPKNTQSNRICQKTDNFAKNK